MEILTHPNPALKQGAAEVDPKTDADLIDLVKAMAKTMYDAPGVGLAAPQLGILKRVIVFDVDDGLVVLCNPKIVSRSEEITVDEEGCLSVPGITVPVPRAESVTCRGLDLKGNSITIDGTDLLARVLQHEIDHLDGVLIVDRASQDDRREAMRTYLQSLERVG